MVHKKIKVGNIVVDKGEFKKGFIKGIEISNSISLDVPILVINGIEDGPTILLTSTEHGTEIQGIRIIHKIMREEINPKKLRGSIIGIPVMNPTAFFAAQYRSWLDNLDVGRVVANNPNGSAMEKLAYNLWTEALSKADIWINMHGNVRADSIFFSEINTSDPRNREQNIKMAEAFGYTIIYSDKPIGDNAPPTYRNLVTKKGVPYILVEFIDCRFISEPSTSTGIRGTLNIMKLFKMIDGEIEPHPEKFILIPGVNRDGGLLRPKRGGVINLLKKPGEPIKKNEIVAEVYNLHGDVLEKVKMPMDGYVWSYPLGEFEGTEGLLQTVNTGCRLAFIFKHENDALLKEPY